MPRVKEGTSRRLTLCPLPEQPSLSFCPHGQLILSFLAFPPTTPSCVNTGTPHPTVLLLNTQDGMPLILGVPPFFSLEYTLGAHSFFWDTVASSFYFILFYLSYFLIFSYFCIAAYYSITPSNYSWSPQLPAPEWLANFCP